MKQLLLIFSIIFISFLTVEAQNQKLGDQVEIETKDGANVTGTVLFFDENIIRIDSPSLGEVTIQKSQIKKLEILRTLSELDFDTKGYPIDYHGSTHYLASPSAFSLKEGQSYYENIWIFWNSASWGITDHFSLSLGGEVASLLFASRFPIIFISPKISTPVSEKTNIALSSTFFTSPADDFVGFGVVQGLASFGDRNNNLTIGSGFGFSTEGFGNDVVPITLSFMVRVSEKISIVSDNFVITYDQFSGSTGTVSFALRIHAKKPGNSLTAGLFRPFESTGSFVAFPFVSGSIAF